jgi:hypothetical protein
VHQWHVDAPQGQLDSGLWRELRLFGSWQGRLLLRLVQQQYLPPGTALELLCITEIQKLLSNSKVRNVIHSGRITFRVLTNYIPRFDELQSAVMANYNPRSQARPTP